MSNTLNPTGFNMTNTIGGLQPNYGLTPGKMAYNASATYRGDPVILSSGKIAVATETGNSGAATVGMADSFSWVSIAQGRRVWQSYYPGNDSQGNADVDVLFNGNPEALFEVQVTGGPAVQADIGSFFNFASGSGSTYSGLSGFSLDYSTKNPSQGTLPYVLVSLVQAPKTDPASANNLVVVGFATRTLF